jgi:hypothetical protein
LNLNSLQNSTQCATSYLLDHTPTQNHSTSHPTLS